MSLVTVIVPHHLNQNDEYLHWALTAARASEGIDIDLVCISDAEACPVVPEGVTLCWDRSLNNVTKKWHHGLKLAHPKSEYAMIISDDVMVSKFTIKALVDVVGNQRAIIGPASNCDATTRYYANFGYPHKCLIEDIKGREQEVIDTPLGKPILLPQSWIGFYCTLFPRSVIDAVGELDETLDVRHNDVDYCHRASRLGIPSLIHLGAFALHFGDRTLPFCTPPEEYLAADESMNKKYSVIPDAAYI